jgi:hypothetical protein
MFGITHVCSGARPCGLATDSHTYVRYAALATVPLPAERAEVACPGAASSRGVATQAAARPQLTVYTGAGDRGGAARVRPRLVAGRRRSTIPSPLSYTASPPLEERRGQKESYAARPGPGRRVRGVLLTSHQPDRGAPPEKAWRSIRAVRR